MITKKLLAVAMMMAMVILGVQGTALYAAEWVDISGTVYYNGQPLSVMVLANGQYMFTDPADGRYNLNVPLDENGQITLFSFCDNLAPFRTTLNSWEAVDFDINMSAASQGSPAMNISLSKAPSKDGWAKISGRVRNNEGTPLCAMVLANGQQMFTCNQDGAYELEVPLDSNGNITLFGFCDGMLPYKYEIKPLPDVTYKLGDTGKPENYEQTIRDFSQFTDNFDMLPPTFDWRDRSMITQVKDQGNCGSCWAFACVGVLESKILLGGGSLYDISEQQLVSCDDSMWGCSGGSSSTMNFWNSRGPLLESCTGYYEIEIDCDDMSHCEELSYRTTNYYTLTISDKDEIKTSLVKDGPAYFRYDVYYDFFEFWGTYYPGKVYKNANNSFQGGHAVMLIGWDDLKNAWLCKNSWGATGGPNGNGTFWIAYSGHANDLRFGIANISIIKSSGNQKPLANAGADQSVIENAVVNLDGFASNYPDGSIVSYSWKQTGGTSVTLSDANTVKATFTAPEVGSSGESLTFQLTVKDDKGAEATDNCVIKVEDNEDDDIVTFPDRNLENAVRAAINKTSGNIRTSDLNNLSALDASEREITNLEGIQYCTALTDLRLNKNQISDITKLSGLTNLKQLILSNNLISNIQSIANLKNLTNLYMDTNQISDISAVSGLTNLKDVYFWDNQISDISPLVNNSGIGSGDEVELRNNPLSSTSCSTYIPKLEAKGVLVFYSCL